MKWDLVLKWNVSLVLFGLLFLEGGKQSEILEAQRSNSQVPFKENFHGNLDEVIS